MEITILSDDRIGTRDGLRSEHGLSILIRTDSKCILCDTGASSMFAENALAMGIDLSEVDLVFISHAHYDHTGGLEHFLRHHDAPVFISAEAFAAPCFSSRRGGRRNIGADPGLKERFPERFTYISESREIAEGIFAVVPEDHGHPSPDGNRWLEDDFTHELALAIKTEKGLVIISSCSHHGAANIMETCCRHTGETGIAAFIGGLHFIDGPDSGRETDSFCRFLDSVHPETTVLTGHCTGDEAVSHATRNGRCRIRIFHTGDIFTGNDLAV